MNKWIRTILFVFLLSIAAMCTGCEILEDFRLAKEAGRRLDSLNVQLEHATKRIDFLEKENEEAKISWDNQRKFLYGEIASLQEIIPAAAKLTPSSNKFSISSVAGGFFAVSCTDIAAYASGSKVLLSVTNFMSVTTTSVRVHVRYAPDLLDENGKLKEDFMSYFKTATEKIESIEPGAEKIVEIRVPEYKPDQIKILNVSIVYEGIKFISDKRPPK